MSYPWWFVPYLTSPMVIALVAIVHVLVSQYAVGGGILLARENHYALRKNDNDYRRYWKSHARFFILLTVVFGAITGVGIWWTIGLASPLATEVLIRTFVFGWGIEWVFFSLELVAGFGFYYLWDKLPKGTHAAFGWIYAAAAWISLVLITGITAFMLNSRGLFADWAETGSFWNAFLNRQFIPQTLARTGGALLFATFYVYLHATITRLDDKTKEKVVRRMMVPSIVGIVLLLAGMAGWVLFLPKSSLMMLERAAAMNIFLGVFGGASILTVFLLVTGPFLAPRKLTFSTSAALFCLGIAVIGTSEFIREAVRKPFVIDRIVYGNQILVGQSGAIARNGFLDSGVWTRLYLQDLQEKYPNLRIYTEPTPGGSLAPISSAPGVAATAIQNIHGVPDRSVVRRTGSVSGNSRFQPVGNGDLSTKSPSRSKGRTHGVRTVAIDGEEPISPSTLHETMVTIDLPDENVPRPGNEDWLRMEREDQLALGQVLFLHHCNDCHAPDHGYSAAAPMLTGKTEEEIAGFIRHLNRPGFYMPPWCGNDVEAILLARYLVSIRPEMPKNITGEEESASESTAEVPVTSELPGN